MGVGRHRGRRVQGHKALHQGGRARGHKVKREQGQKDTRV